MSEPNKEIYKEFTGHGYRITKARQTILGILSKSKKYMSADDIYLAIKTAGENVGVTTIYRAVDSLAKTGIIRKRSLNNDRAYFEIIDKDTSKHHHHLICRSCQKITDYSHFLDEEIKLIKKLEKIVSKVHQFKIEDHQLSFTGLCKLCQSKGGD